MPTREKNNTRFESTAHRPWPVVDRPWVMHMRWHDLMFAHWPIDTAALRPLVPRGLEIDTYDGRAWVGVVPFRMDGVRLRGLPPMPTAGAFAEINVRTYVTDGRKPGVWFLSLDAPSRLGIAIARRWYRLNYSYARIACRHEGDWVRYESRRGDGGAEFVGRYRPVGEPFTAPRASLERWLCERYCMYAGGWDRPIYRGEIHHGPWELRRCEVEVERNTMAEALGLALPGTVPHALFATRMETVVWGPRKVDLTINR